MTAAIGGVVVLAIIVTVAPGLLERPHQNAAISSGLQEAAFAFQTGLNEWAADHQGVYPSESRFTKEGLGLSEWPVDPFSGRQMSRGRHPGGFVYQRGPGKKSYRLALYGGDGDVYLTIGEP
jgi:hypothetical protein